MAKRINNNRGFTLVELMLVIAVIGILATVLIPRMGFVRDVARETGLDVNARVAEATVTSLLHRHSTRDPLITALDARLEGILTNPFSLNTAAISTAAPPAVSPVPAVIFYTGTAAWPGLHPAAAGAVVVAIPQAIAPFTVDIFYINRAGARVAESLRVVN